VRGSAGRGGGGGGGAGGAPWSEPELESESELELESVAGLGERGRFPAAAACGGWGGKVAASAHQAQAPSAAQIGATAASPSEKHGRASPGVSSVTKTCAYRA